MLRLNDVLIFRDIVLFRNWSATLGDLVVKNRGKIHRFSSPAKVANG